MPINLGQNILGPKIFIEGNIQTEEELIIEGKVKGNRIDSGNHPLIVGLQGEVSSDLYAGEIIIYGKVKGNCYAKKSIYLGDKAIVDGDLHAPLIDIEPTSTINGRLIKR